ncbi:rod shape-determining protein MreC [Flavobacteriaceae bacterium MHTCC 0001]
MSGNIYNSVNNMGTYFSLKTQNKLLVDENNRLNELLSNYNIDTSKFKADSAKNVDYQYTPANVIKNSYNVSNNFLLLNKGENDGIAQDFGVISQLGIVGIIDNVSANYATVISILNTKSSISVRLKNSRHIGSLTWNGKSPNVIQLTDVEKVAVVNKGDTIVTSGESFIFPKDIPVGTVLDYKLDDSENFYEINIKLFNDMTNIEHVYIIENNDKDEIETLLNNTNE